MSEPVKVFLSYSHQDEELRNELVKHLGGLRRRGLIDIWHDRKILAGTEWAEQIDKNLEQAHIVLFLVSADFIDSKYCFDIEMTRALERHNGKTAHVIPVIVRECDWHHAPFAKLQAVPTDGKAVTTWGTDRYAPDRAWTVVAKEIGKIAQQVADELEALKRSLENVPPDSVPTELPSAEVKATEPQRSQKIELETQDKASSQRISEQWLRSYTGPPAPPILGGDRPKVLHFSPQNWGAGGAHAGLDGTSQISSKVCKFDRYIDNINKEIKRHVFVLLSFDNFYVFLNKGR